MHKPLLSRGKVKTRDARTCVFAFSKMILYRLIGYYLLLELQNGRGRFLVDFTSCSLHPEPQRENFPGGTTVDTGPQAVKSFFVGWGVDLHLKVRG